MAAHRLRARTVTLALIATLVAMVASPALARDDDLAGSNPVASIPGEAVEALADAWFIELASPPASKGTSRGVLARERDVLRSSLARSGVQFNERFAFEGVWNGLSVNMSPSSVSLVARLSGVRGVYPVVDVPKPATTSVSDPELWTALLQTGAGVAQAAGWTGAGVRVGVIDSGIDYHHPDLGGCFGAGCRVFTGRDFVGDLYNASGTTAQQTRPRPDNDPDDCGGHGTHVSGIIGANGDPATGGARGVAPGVSFGAYRVFGCDGSTSADIMASAMERAYADGMHVVNMSIGSAFQWPSYPTAVAANNLADAGVVVVASIGNSGSNGQYSSSAPGIGEKVIGVAAFDNTHLNSLSFVVDTSEQRVPYQPLSSSSATVAPPPAPPTSGTSEEIVHVGRGCVADPALGLATDDPYLNDPKDKVALIERGTCAFNVKYQRAAAAGAVGVMIYAAASSPSIFIGGFVTGVDDVFGISISRADGLHIASQTGPKAIWTDDYMPAPIATGNLTSSFSSYGLAPDLSLKPDIGAPGGFIFSTIPLEQGGYGVLSGTSMSSPHVAGAVAAYLQAHPGTLPADVRTALQNSADPVRLSSNPALGLEFIQRQGAGMLDIPGAIAATTVVTPAKIALGESGGAASYTKTLTVRNETSASVTYSFTHAAALATNANTFSPGATTFAASVSFSQLTLTVAAQSEATVDATISVTAPATLAERRQYGGFLVVTGGGQTYRVPYAGYRGDYQSIVALTATSNELPWLAKRTGVNVDPNAPIKDYAKQSAGATYTFKRKTLDDVPYVLFHLDHQVSRITIDVYKDGASTPWGRVLDRTDFGRSSTSTGFFTFAWGGKAADLTSPNPQVVKDGAYFFKITVLKALGDPANAAHSESWESPVFNVLREGDETAPTSTDVRVSTNAASASQLDAGDAFKVVFSELMLAPTAGSAIRAQDADGTEADIVCGTNATCTLNSVDEAVGGTTHGSGKVLTVTASAAITGTGGTTAGLQLPATIVSSTITDRSQNGWDLAGSTDVVIDTE